MTQEEKAAAYDKLEECFLRQSFGTVTKSELELCFFSILFQHRRGHGLAHDDYTLSNILRIPQSRVRSLKVRMQLSYQYLSDWRQELLSQVKAERFSVNDGVVTMLFHDPNLRIEVEHFLEEQDQFCEYTLNSKLLKMNAKGFVLLLLEIGEIDEEAEGWKQLHKRYAAQEAQTERITKEKMHAALSGAKDFGKELILELAKSFAAGRM